MTYFPFFHALSEKIGFIRKKVDWRAFSKGCMLKNAKKPIFDTKFQIHFAAFVCKIGKKTENLALHIELLFLKSIRSFLYVSRGRPQPCKTFPNFWRFFAFFSRITCPRTKNLVLLEAAENSTSDVIQIRRKNSDFMHLASVICWKMQKNPLWTQIFKFILRLLYAR